MLKVKARAILTVLIFVVLAPALMCQKAKVISNGYLKASEFLDLSDGQKVGFAMGFVDGMFMAPLFDAPDDNKSYVAFRVCMADMSAPQVAAIIEKYVKNNPEQWHLQLHTVAFNSILNACHVTP